MSNTVFITGASSGIGRATAERFAREGWNVVATMRRPEAGADLASDTTLVTRLDVADEETIAPAAEAALVRFGQVDLLVNNAGYGQAGVFETISREKVFEQFAVNVFGVMDVTRALLPQFRARRAGAIVNVSSGAGLFTLPLMSLYSASKFALEGWSEALSYELGAVGIAVKLVIPHGGVTETRFSDRTMGEAPERVISDYDAFIARSRDTIARMGGARTQGAADIAEAIFSAATDGTNRLRYLVGDDARGFVRARYELSEEDYIAFMRSRFAE
ncbi:MAG: SDR family oxidoreductase [Devosia sp.]|nr:SDR family oxidoreductase [Devosia sp.]